MSLRDREEGFFTPSGIVHILGLILSIIVVGFVYSVIIRPEAEKIQIAEAYGVEAQLAQGGSSLFIVLKDYEQQACFTLMFWVLMILAYKYYLVQAEKSTLLREERYRGGSGLLRYGTSGNITLSDAPETLAHLEDSLEQQQEVKAQLLPHLLAKGLERFIYSGSIQEASDVVKARIDVAAERLDSELSIIRYIAWAIPSVGFIGTVRGIGAALAQADQALEGDISGVTSSLGLAFNSTLVALFISIFLMFFIHTLQSRQEGTILAIETFCREHLIDRLRIQEPAPQVDEVSP